MDAWITHLGHALPGQALPQAKITAWLQQRLAPGTDPERLRRFAELSEVKNRYAAIDIMGAEGHAIYPLHSPHADTLERSRAFTRLAAPLASRAVHNAGLHDLDSISHLIVTTCTGAVAPGLDLQLIDLLGLSPTVRRTMIGFMGCHAAMPAIRLAADTVRAHPNARVLIVCCELSSLHFQTGPDDDALIAACLFGDGASAAVVESAPSGQRLRIVRDACAVAPDSADAMAWTAAADGFRLRLSPNIANALGSLLPQLTDTLLSHLSRDCLRWIVHPGGPRILTSVEKLLELPDTALLGSRHALAAAGNRSSATIFAILADTCATPWSGPIALYAFGPGLTAEALLLERHE